jgi:Phage Terminase
VSSTPTVTAGLSSKPRWGTKRRLSFPTRGPLDRQVAALLGWEFFPWQSDVSDVAGEYHPDSRIPAYRTVGVSVGRQNGKTTLVCSRIARQLIPPRQTVAYTAQDRGLARTKWEEHVGLLLSTPFAERVDHIDRTNHREMLVMDNGSRYLPVTPTSKKAARSLSIDLAVIDEAHAHEDMGVVGAIQPAMAARPHAQIWLLSNAGNIRSGLWRHYTDVGRLEVDNPASTMCWFEYAPAGEADDIDVFDHQAWGEANPSLGLPGGVLETALSDAALTLDRQTFFREHLNVWTEANVFTGIDGVTWAACRRDNLIPTAPVAFGLDFTPERDRGALGVAGVTELDDVTAVELIEAGSDLDRIVARAAEVANTWDALITIDRGSPAASAIPALERLTDDGQGHNKVRLIPLVELVRACGEFHDAAVAARLSHRGDYRLSDAVTAATKRRVGEAWAWARRGNADISPLIAVTLARWGLITAPVEVEQQHYLSAGFG